MIYDNVPAQYFKKKTNVLMFGSRHQWSNICRVYCISKVIMFHLNDIALFGKAISTLIVYTSDDIHATTSLPNCKSF